jgi:hypothetical protein
MDYTTRTTEYEENGKKIVETSREGDEATYYSKEDALRYALEYFSTRSDDSLAGAHSNASPKKVLEVADIFWNWLLAK